MPNATQDTFVIWRRGYPIASSRAADMGLETNLNGMRIAMLTATFPPYYAGTGNVAFKQAEGLAARDHDVMVFTATYQGEPADPTGVTVIRRDPIFRLGNAPLTPQLLRLKGYDVLHLHQPFIFGAEMTTVASQLRRIPLVSSIHNELVADGLRGRLFDFYSSTVLPLTLRRSRIIAGLTDSHVRSLPQVARELQRHPEKLRLVPNAVDVEEFTPGAPDRDLLAEAGVPEHTQVAMVCAVLDDAHLTKRVDLAIAATAQLPGWHLLVVGKGPLLDSFKAQAARLGVADRVHFLGFQPDLTRCYRSCDVLLVCSDKLESFSLTQAEAMACGKPVIVCDLPGVRDVSIPGEHGFHCKPGDLNDLVAKVRAFGELSSARRRQMGTAARKHVLANFTWTQSVNALDSALRAAVEMPVA